MKKKILIIGLLVVLSLLIAVKLFFDKPFNSLQDVREDVALLKQEISNTIQLSASNVSQCKLIQLKDFNGFDPYLVYSTETTNEEILINLVEEHNILIKEAMREFSMVQQLPYVIPPDLTLESGLCKTTYDR